MTRRDVHAAARLHASQLPHGFFPRLGRPFLAEYYRAFGASPHAVALVAADGARIAGVLVGVLDPAHHRWVLRNRGARLAAAACLSLVARPWLLKPLLTGRLRRYLRAAQRIRRGRTSATSATPAPTTAVLSHVAVADELRGLGVGTRLAEAFVAAARQAGIAGARTTTLDGPDGAAPFYLRTGWAVQARATDWDGNAIVVLTRATS